MSLRFLPPLCLLLCLFGGANQAWTMDAGALWTNATEAMADGDDANAVSLLDALAREYPAHALTDDALFLAGNLLEEKLGDPEEARSRYRQLLEHFPDSRSALAAERRLSHLERGLGMRGEGAKVLVEFREILRGYPNREVEESIRLAKVLVTNNPQWLEIHRIHLWLAATTRRTGDLTEAASYYTKVTSSSSPPSAQIKALLGLTEVAILSGEYAKAEASLEILARRDDLSRSNEHAVDELRELLSSSRQRETLLYASGIAFVVVQLLFLGLLHREGGSFHAVRQALVRPTTEFFYMLPMSALLIIMALTGHQEIGPAVAIICIGGLITTYLASAVLEQARPLTTSRAMLCASASLIATVSICYLALQRSQLLDLVATTVRFGPE